MFLIKCFYLIKNSMLARIRPSSAICQPNTEPVALSKLGFLPVALCLASCLSQALVSFSPSVLDLWSFSAWYRSSVSRSRFRPFRNMGNTQLEKIEIFRFYCVDYANFPKISEGAHMKLEICYVYLPKTKIWKYIGLFTGIRP